MRTNVKQSTGKQNMNRSQKTMALERLREQRIISNVDGRPSPALPTRYGSKNWRPGKRSSHLMLTEAQNI